LGIKSIRSFNFDHGSKFTTPNILFDIYNQTHLAASVEIFQQIYLEKKENSANDFSCLLFECPTHSSLEGTVFPHIVAAATILFWKLRCGNYSREETIQRRKLLISCFFCHHKNNQ
jgi:hypothetical protein